MGIKVQGLRAAVEGLQGLSARLRDARPWTQVAAEKIRTVAEEAIQAASEPDGSPWAPLAPSTIRRKRGGGSPGVETGRSLGSLEAHWGTQSAGMSASTDASAYLNDGTGRQPARRFVPAIAGALDPALEVELVDDLVTYVRGDL
jgi:hypothetical protein